MKNSKCNRIRWKLISKTVAVLLLVGIISGSIMLPIYADETDTVTDTTVTDTATPSDESSDSTTVPDETKKVELELMTENDMLKLFYDKTTGGIAVENKASGKITYSSPPNADNDSKASEIIKNQIKSPLIFTYYSLSKKNEDKMDAYSQATLLDQVKAEKIDNGVRVNMTLGREQQQLAIPQLVTAAFFDETMGKLDSERKIKQMKAFYIKYTLEGADEKTKADLIQKYPVIEETDLYSLKSSATDRDKSVIENNMTGIGYTVDTIKAEHEKTGFNADDQAFPYFKFAIDYTLKDGHIEVDLDVNAIEYDKEKFYLTDISMLTYFGAGENGKEGHVFLPDGSGSIINFNNDLSKNIFLTKSKTYGIDGAENSMPRGSFKNEYRFPVFGVKTEDSAIFGIITEGAAVSEINCELSNFSHSYNAAYSNFIIRKTEQHIEPGAIEQAPWVVYDKFGYSGKIGIDYYFLEGDNANYVGMAKSYQDYLLTTNQISKLAKDEKLPFMLDTIGLVEESTYDEAATTIGSKKSVTTTNEALSMLAELSEVGVNNVKLRYKAWYNGGYYYTPASKLSVESKVGGKSGFEELNKKATELGASIFPDVDFIYGCSNKNFDGFNPSKDNVRTLFQKMGFYPTLSVTKLTYNDMNFCITPTSIMRNFKNFTKAYDKMNIPNISLSTTGKGVNSNYKNNNYVNRQDSMYVIEELLKSASEKYDEVITDYGNAYTIPYSDYILNMEDCDSSFVISDASVPFAQMALHGYIKYSSSPINLSSTLEKDVLKYIEYGQIPYFLLNYADSSVLRQSLIYDEIYSVNFSEWKDNAVKIYNKLNDAIGDVQNKTMVNHETVEKDVYITTYSNGKRIGVNYKNIAVEVDGISIEPMGYAVINQSGGE